MDVISCAIKRSRVQTGKSHERVNLGYLIEMGWKVSLDWNKQVS